MSGINDTSKFTSCKVLETALSHLKTKETPVGEECTQQSELTKDLNTASSTRNDFGHQEIDSLPLWSMQHAIMTLNNPSGAEVMTAENVNHIQVSCSPNFM